MSIAVGIASLAVWGYLLFGRGGFWLSPLDKSSLRPAANDDSRKVAVTAVIPARDEAASIADAVESLRKQTYTGALNIIVVDDNSSDNTAELARAHGATVISGTPLPFGWTGKMWAVAQGVEAARRGYPEYVLLTDADVVHSPENVTRLLQRADSGAFDLVSLMVLLRCDSVAERALMPAFVFFFLMLYPPAWIASPRHRTAGAAGGCILIRRGMLERAGGIAAIRGELIDDCALARAVKRSGGRVWLGLTQETRSVRAYPGFGPIWAVISRTAFTQLDYSPLVLIGSLAALAITYLAPPVLLMKRRWPEAALGAGAWLMMSTAYAPMLRFYGLGLLWAPVLPLVALFYTAATIDSALRYWSGRGGQWKGRPQAVRKF